MCLCLLPNEPLRPGWIGSMCCNWCCLIVLNITVFWEQKFSAMNLMQIQTVQGCCTFMFHSVCCGEFCVCTTGASTYWRNVMWAPKAKCVKWHTNPFTIQKWLSDSTRVFINDYFQLQFWLNSWLFSQLNDKWFIQVVQGDMFEHCVLSVRHSKPTKYSFNYHIWQRTSECFGL